MTERFRESEPISIERAIAERIWKETERKNEQVAEFNGTPPQPVSIVEKEARVALTTSALSQLLQSPNFRSDKDIMGLPLYESIRREMSSKDLRGVDNDQLDIVLSDTTGAAIDSIYGPEGTNMHELRKLKNAYDIADERSVHVADVYRDDELYKELIRRSFKPEDLAVIIKSQTPMLDVDKLVQAIAGGLIKALRLSEKEAEEIYEEMKSEPGFLEKVQEVKDNTVKLTNYVLAQELTHYWGEEVAKSVLEGN